MPFLIDICKDIFKRFFIIKNNDVFLQHQRKSNRPSSNFILKKIEPAPLEAGSIDYEIYFRLYDDAT